MLHGNYSVLNKSPTKALAGSTISTTRSNSNKPGMMRSVFYGNFNKFAAFPLGTEPPYSQIIAQTGGGLASFTSLAGTGSLALDLAKGINLTSSLAGTSSIVAVCRIIAEVVSTLTGSSSTTATLGGANNLVSSITASGTLASSLNLASGIVAALSGSGAVTGTAVGKANCEASISPFTELSPQNLAIAVWNALASEFNTAGTMGERLNDAGAAGNPWAALLADNNDPGSFGERVQKLLTLAKFLGLK